jgi:hypothetical protein
MSGYRLDHVRPKDSEQPTLRLHQLGVIPVQKAFVAGVFLMAVASEAGAVCYVGPTIAGDGSGSSWSSAASSLEWALANPVCSEIHVAAGVYTPRRVPRSFAPRTFKVLSGTKLIGGYAGTGADPDARDPSIYPTILSGDFDNDDANASTSHIDWSTADIHGDNALHVLTLNGDEQPITDSTVIDGFVITGGYAHTGDKFDFEIGGGLLCQAEKAGAECSPKLQNLMFAGNYADEGGAIANYGDSSPQIANSRFTGNQADDQGGAIANIGAYANASPSIVSSTFDSNEAAFGGAIYNDGRGGQAFTFIQNSTFTHNATNYDRGAGAVLCNEGRTSGIAGAFLLNVTSSANDNQGTSAFENWGDGGFSEIFAANSILWDSESGTEVVDDGAASEFNHSVVREGCPATAGWCSRVIVDDPALGAFQSNGGNLPTMMPDASSVAIDNGTDEPSICPATDERGIARPQGAHCDIGAVERRSTE